MRNISTPCVKQCKIEGEHCLGCARHINDIRNWLSYSESKRKELMTGHRYRTKYGIFPTIELAAGRLGVSVEAAEKMIIRDTGEIVVISI